MQTLTPRSFDFSEMSFVSFVNRSPTPYHAVKSSIEILEKAGFERIRERESWKLEAGRKYYVTRNTSSLIAFALGSEWVPGSPSAIVGAHTDSPTLRLKPRSAIEGNGYVELAVETYGGGLWPTWFDRDLSIAGRVFVKANNRTEHRLVKIDKPLLRIPTLAIHLHREQSTKLEFNKETHLKPILELQGSESDTNEDHPTGLVSLIAKTLEVNIADIEDFELVLYDTQPAQIGGLNDEFIFSPRLDNLNSCWCALQGLTGSSSKGTAARIIALFDHEEVGSVSAQGAASNFLESILGRINSKEHVSKSVAQSFLISADMAHAVHPNYPAAHEAAHQPAINAGPVIKTNANQRYATNAFGSVLLTHAADIASVPLQKFVVRNDSSCGSTIGPMLASNLGMRTIDIGNPQLSMHSIRETGGVKDIEYSINLFEAYFTNFEALEASVDLD